MKKVRIPARSALALGSLALLTLTACSSQQDDATVSASSAASTSVSATASAKASPSASSVAPSETPEPSASVETVEPTAESTQTPVIQEDTPAASEQPTAAATTAPEATPAPTPTVSIITVPAPGNNPVATASSGGNATEQAQTCNYGDIHIAAATAEGAAGSRYITLTFTNSGASPCMISGWPTVNYVDARGNAIGAPASQAAEWTNSGEVLQPGSSATATLRETRADLYGDTCQAVTASGYQVGIPGTDSSLTLSFPAEACSNASISQLSVGQVGANS